MIKKWHSILAGMAMATFSYGAAADNWPTREIALTVSFSAGGVTDIVGRTVAKALSKDLGVPVVVVNRPGGQGTIGQDFVRRQKPDGYNLAIVSSSSTAFSPYVVKDVYKPTDFQYIGGIGVLRFGMAVNANSPYQTIGDLIEASKKESLFYGVSSASIAMGFEGLATKSGAKFEGVNYKSGAEIVMAVIGGQVTALMQAPSEVLPHVKAGKLRLLASVGTTRWPSAPDVPTLREAGYDVAVESWIGVAAPKGLPTEIASRLESALKKVASDPAMKEALDQLGVDSKPLSADDFGNRMQSDYVAAGPFMKKYLQR